MDNEETGSPGWNPFFFMQTTEDAVKAVAAVSATGTGACSPRPPVVFSSKDDSGGQLQKLQRQVSRVLKGLSNPPIEKGRTYNPEVLTIQKRQWASSQLQSLVCTLLSSGYLFVGCSSLEMLLSALNLGFFLQFANLQIIVTKCVYMGFVQNTRN